MVRRRLRWMIFGCWASLLPLSASGLMSQGVDVSAKIMMRASRPGGDEKRKHPPSAANVVVWLEPLQAGAARVANPPRQTPYRLVQKNKQFIPHLLVVPTGTSVEFPNEDPFFHNVFSLFNGKRFDLGLYESGTTRSVRFDREGVSYIFCNIHPEMGAVVMALSTPYYGTSDANGIVLIRGVPPGNYRVNVWSENAQPLKHGEPQRTVQVSAESVQLGEISLQVTADPMEKHKNKFGEDYQPSTASPY
jgi:plastocyanin